MNMVNFLRLLKLILYLLPVTILCYLLYKGILSRNRFVHVDNVAGCSSTVSGSLKDIVELEKLLYTVHRSARSSNTKLLVEKGIQRLHKIMNDFHIELNQASQTKYQGGIAQTDHWTTNEVCAEYFGDPKADTVIFNDNYKSRDCTRIPLNSLVEILLYVNSCTEGQYLAERIHEVHPDISLYVAVRESPKTCPSAGHIKYLMGVMETASTWLKLTEFGTTKYILVGRNMVDFTNHTDIDRMLRVIHSLNADVVGGAVRLEPEGKWYAGCYQTIVRNFTIRIHPGHDLSALSCAYCDYIASPFLIRRDLFQSKMGRSEFEGIVPFVDFFLKLQHENDVSRTTPVQIVACVDVLFYVAGGQSTRGEGVAELSKLSWQPLVKQWTVNRLLLPGSVEHHWSCTEVEIQCNKFKHRGLTLPGCCMQELSVAVKGFVSLANKHNITVTLFSGNIIGVVKTLGGILPWERDSDIGWDAEKYMIMENEIRTALQNEYKLMLGTREMMTKHGVDITKCRAITMNSCLYYALSSANWRLQLYDEPVMISRWLQGLRNPTLVNFDGMWIETVPNPGRVVRHQYGDNILAHVEHAFDLGDTSRWGFFKFYQVSSTNFSPCPKDAIQHACLSGNYLTTGNIQFQDIFI